MPEQFAADWLALREPADHAARAASLIGALQASLPGQRPLRILDLGAGSGSNLRYLAPRLAGAQHWRLVDHDPDLLAQASAHWPSAHTGSAPHIETHCEDLDTLVAHSLPSVDLVTASALLDLVSREWLESLAHRCAEQQVAVLIALSVDGRSAFADPLPDDGWIREAINAHQRGTKDMGQALGPDAPAAAAEAFQAAGYRVSLASSDWCLGPSDAALQQALVAGWADAAQAQDPAHQASLRRWYEARCARLPDQALRVGHQDLLALPCPR